MTPVGASRASALSSVPKRGWKRCRRRSRLLERSVASAPVSSNLSHMYTSGDNSPPRIANHPNEFTIMPPKPFDVDMLVDEDSPIETGESRLRQVEKENENLRAELVVLRAALHAMQQRELQRGESPSCETEQGNGSLLTKSKSPSILVSQSFGEAGAFLSDSGMKHRKSPVDQHRPAVDASTMLERCKTDLGDDHDVEMAPLVLHQSPHQSLTNTPTFLEAVGDRASWLVGLLILQSMSSFIISRNEALLQRHLVIVQFLTMLVGAGGNGGNQSSVHVIRGLATGGIRCWKGTLWREMGMGFALAVVVGATGAVRAALFATPALETLAITTSLVMIVFLSVLLGAALPLAMQLCGIDPAHSSTTIQVLMDILGVTITVQVSSFVLDSAIFQGFEALLN